MEPFESLAPMIGAVMAGYVAVMVVLGWFASRRVDDVEDYVVAGRRLGFWLATPTLLATWFGAGTLLTATDEVRSAGITGATLDPLGAGICLVLVGVFFARPLWEAKVLTLPDYFAISFDNRAELVSALLMVPPYFGWIAAQFLAMAGMLELFFGLSPELGVALVALVGVGYTLMGGMWAVTLTDALQMALVVLGLGVLAVVVGIEVMAHPGGVAALIDTIPDDRLKLVQTEDVGAFLTWSGVLLAGALGNIPSQDVMQRVFSASSSRVAQASCVTAGILYMSLGALPVAMGLVAGTWFDAESETLPRLAALFLHPALAVVFVVTLMSVVLSTIDSAILAPATVLARNVAPRWQRLEHSDPLVLTRACLVVVGMASLVAAYLGESAYGLLESGYELGMVSLLAPLVFALVRERPSATGALGSMGIGTGMWSLHFALGWESFMNGPNWAPIGLVSMVFAFVAYLAGERIDAGRAGRP